MIKPPQRWIEVPSITPQLDFVPVFDTGYPMLVSIYRLYRITSNLLVRLGLVEWNFSHSTTMVDS
jgi:hypothetical protein